jgi:hypothetical protein
MKRRLPVWHRTTFAEADAGLRPLLPLPCEKTIANAGRHDLSESRQPHFPFRRQLIPPFFIDTGSQKNIQSP